MAEKFKTRERNTFIFHHNYRVDTELGKGVCDISWISCACTDCVNQFDKYLLPTISTSSQPRYAYIENCDYKKTLKHYNDWIIITLLDNNAPHVEFDNIHEFILAVISNNKV